jgi:hypothetical protein
MTKVATTYMLVLPAAFVWKHYLHHTNLSRMSCHGRHVALVHAFHLDIVFIQHVSIHGGLLPGRTTPFALCVAYFLDLNYPTVSMAIHEVKNNHEANEVVNQTNLPNCPTRRRLDLYRQILRQVDKSRRCSKAFL